MKSPPRQGLDWLAQSIVDTASSIAYWERDKWGQHWWGHCKVQVFRQRDFLRAPVDLLLSSQKCQGLLFSPNLSKFATFAAAPLALTRFVRNQDVLQSPPQSVPATWKHGWSKHGCSIIPSNLSIPQDSYSPCFNLTNSARTMFTPTMFSRRRVLWSLLSLYNILPLPGGSLTPQNLPRSNPHISESFLCGLGVSRKTGRRSLPLRSNTAWSELNHRWNRNPRPQPQKFSKLVFLIWFS